MRTPKKGSALGTVIEIVVIVAAAFVIAMLVQAFLFKPFTVHQVSMQNTLIEGDRILINRVVYHFRDPKPGDVIVFHSPVAEKEDLVKRVVAVAGDTVAVHDGALYVNGVRKEEPYLKEQDFRGELQDTAIPAGHVFVMGDNRNNSGDSRMFGPIPIDSIIGKAFVIYWPISHWGGL
jgi:signal peptidase I